MSSYDAKQPLVLGRQLEVQKLTIPLLIVGNATPADVSLASDEPSVLFLRSAGVDQITAALASGEVATYSVSPVDATGVFNILVKVQEPILKVEKATVINRLDGTLKPCYLGSASGITVINSLEGTSIMLTCTSGADFATGATLNACLEVQYIVDSSFDPSAY